MEGNYLVHMQKLKLITIKEIKNKTSKGFRSYYNVDMPIISDTNTLTNTYGYKFFTELYEENITQLAL